MRIVVTSERHGEAVGGGICDLMITRVLSSSRVLNHESSDVCLDLQRGMWMRNSIDRRVIEREREIEALS